MNIYNYIVSSTIEIIKTDSNKKKGSQLLTFFSEHQIIMDWFNSNNYLFYIENMSGYQNWLRKE